MIIGMLFFRADLADGADFLMQELYHEINLLNLPDLFNLREKRNKKTG